MQGDLRIWFETPERGQESHGNRASGVHHIAPQNTIVRCNMASLGDAVKTEQKKMGETCHGPLDRTIEVILVAKSDARPAQNLLQAHGARITNIKGGNRSSIARCRCRTSPGRCKGMACVEQDGMHDGPGRYPPVMTLPCSRANVRPTPQRGADMAPRFSENNRCSGTARGGNMPKISQGAWRSAVAIALSVIVVGAVAGIFAGLATGIFVGLAMLPVAIALDWETRRRREFATRSKATEGD